MKILKTNTDSNIVFNNENISKNDLGWSESFANYEKDILESIINPTENYETIRYIHKPYSGITDDPSLLQSDIWFYFYLISGISYVQNYEAVGLSNADNAKLLKTTTNSFFRLEFYKTPNNESPTRLNRRLVFAKNLSIPLGEKYFITGNTINNYVHVPVFVGSNYRNKENMYLFWFLDDTAFNETTLTGNTFYMSARFFNSIDGSIIEFTNKDLSADNSLLFSSRRGVRTTPIKFYEKGISGANEIIEQEDTYYRLEIDRTDYTYQVFYDTNNLPPSPTPSPTTTPAPTITPTVTPPISITPTITPTITPSVTFGFVPGPSQTPTITGTPAVTPSSSAIQYIQVNIYASTNSAIVGYAPSINIGYNINGTGWTSTALTVSSNPNTPSLVYSISVPVNSNIYFALRNYTGLSDITFGANTSSPASYLGYCGRSSSYQIINITSNTNVYMNAYVLSYNIQTC